MVMRQLSLLLLFFLYHLSILQAAINAGVVQNVADKLLTGNVKAALEFAKTLLPEEKKALKEQLQNMGLTLDEEKKEATAIDDIKKEIESNLGAGGFLPSLISKINDLKLEDFKNLCKELSNDVKDALEIDLANGKNKDFLLSQKKEASSQNEPLNILEKKFPADREEMRKYDGKLIEIKDFWEWWKSINFNLSSLIGEHKNYLDFIKGIDNKVIGIDNKVAEKLLEQKVYKNSFEISINGISTSITQHPCLSST